MKYLSLAVLTSVVLLTSCTGSGPAIDPQRALNGCDWTKFIRVGKDDKITEATAKEILTHNRTRKRICG